MISKMNYLLLITVMIAVIDNSYGRCCPCEKKKGEKKNEKKEIIDTVTGNGAQSIDMHNDLEKNLINDDDNDENTCEHSKNEEKNKDVNEFLKNPNNNEELLINQIIVEAKKNNFICNACENTKGNESKIKFVYADPGTRTGEKPALKIADLEFGFCKKHKE